MLVPVNKKIEIVEKETPCPMDNQSSCALIEGISQLNKLIEESNGNSTEEISQIIDQIHMLLLMGNEQFNSKIIEILPSFYSFLNYKNFYLKICLILSDISHLNEKVVDSLLNYQIFEKLDFTEKVSFSLIFSICDQNRLAWQSFKECLVPEYRENEYIKILLEQ
jgi:hypothetical protein